jgi:F-type H+-transporting ATPase subunit a
LNATISPFLAVAAGTEGAGPLFTLFGLQVTSHVTTTWAVMAVLILLGFLSTRGLKREPRGLQNAMELALEALLHLFTGIMGRERAKQAIAFLGTLFLFIIMSNYSGMIPGAGMVRGFAAPTSTWSVTLGLGLCSLVAVQYFGVRRKGLRAFSHLFQPWFLTPINVLEELVRPVSLSLRLFGNVFGEEMVVATLLMVVPYFLPIVAMLLGLIFGAVQAIIFTVLTSVYIAMATADHH